MSDQNLFVPRPGRPRQLYCPDCKKEGNPFVKKKDGQGYCATHHYRRTKESYIRRMQAANPNYVPREALAPTLEDDIKNYIKGGHEMPIEMIQNLYVENGLPKPDEDDVLGKYYPQKWEAVEELRRTKGIITFSEKVHFPGKIRNDPDEVSEEAYRLLNPEGRPVD
jgi:uncharacterized Zn finger protein (UPF0148 family)